MTGIEDGFYANQIVEWLTNPYVMTLLLVIGLIGVAVEIFHPGFGLPGIIGIIAFALYFYSHIEAGYGDWLSPVLFILAIILFFIEVLIPGVGIFGISGVILLFYSIISVAANTTVGLVALAIALAITMLIIWMLVKVFGMKLIWNRVVLISEQKNEEGYRSSEDRKGLLNEIGVTITPLRPAGVVQFGERREDVVSEREMIPVNVKVIVVRVEGTRVVVRRYEDQRTNQS